MKKILKIFGWIFLGYIIAVTTYVSGDKIIGTEISPNGKYKLIYSATRYGGILPMEYRHYIEVRRVSDNELMFLEFIKSDDVISLSNDARWDADTIVVQEGYCKNDNSDGPYKRVTTFGKTTFYLVDGYATK
ncbi:hypothetical protein J7L67_03635 [bacterium]|nr:hypothetical protein [bacterium]